MGKDEQKGGLLRPGPRILDWKIWHEVPLELKPFLTWDDLFDRPGFRSPDGSEYEKAMSRKATRWWNAMMARFL